jgi:hypothetical protein
MQQRLHGTHLRSTFCPSVKSLRYLDQNLLHFGSKSLAILHKYYYFVQLGQYFEPNGPLFWK